MKDRWNRRLFLWLYARFGGSPVCVPSRFWRCAAWVLVPLDSLYGWANASMYRAWSDEILLGKVWCRYGVVNRMFTPARDVWYRVDRIEHGTAVIVRWDREHDAAPPEVKPEP